MKRVAENKVYLDELDHAAFSTRIVELMVNDMFFPDVIMTYATGGWCDVSNIVRLYELLEDKDSLLGSQLKEKVGYTYKPFRHSVLIKSYEGDKKGRHSIEHSSKIFLNNLSEYAKENPIQVCIWDDVFDTGESDSFRRRIADIPNFRTASTAVKDWSKHKPDYCGFQVNEKTWLIFCSEKNDLALHIRSDGRLPVFSSKNDLIREASCAKVHIPKDELKQLIEMSSDENVYHIRDYVFQTTRRIYDYTFRLLQRDASEIRKIIPNTEPLWNAMMEKEDLTPSHVILEKH
jgi:hypoxanthine phosphoribosyltransferase